MKKKSDPDAVVRLSLPVRTKEQQDADTDSEDDEQISVLVNKFKQICKKSGVSSSADYLSLPQEMKDVQLSSKLDSGLDNLSYHRTEGDLIVTDMKNNVKKDEDYSGAALAEFKPHIGKKKLKKLKKEERDKTKGKDWYNMTAPELTEETQRDLELIQMRHVLDPKRHYKKNNSDTLPKYFQIGTVVDNAADFYTDRVAKKDRKQTMVDELLADAEFKKYQKRKYVEIIEDKAKKQGRHYMKKKKKS